MKRMICAFLAICLLFTSVPLSAIADSTYSVNFTISKDNNEDDFRQWAARLMDMYIEKYAVLKKNISTGPYQYLTSGYRFYDWGWNLQNHWPLTEKTEFPQALYYPYYNLGERKEFFNGSTYANQENKYIQGLMKRKTAFSDLSDDEKRQLYLWILRNTIVEKVESDPEYFTKIHDTEGFKPKYYVFDVNSGTWKADEMTKKVVEQAVADAWKDAAKTVVSLAKTAAKIIVTYHEVVSEYAARAAEEAQAKAQKRIATKNIIKDLLSNLKNESIDFVAATLDDIIDKNRDNDNKKIQNAINAALMAELMNELQNCNNNAIYYLKTVYLGDSFVLSQSDADRALYISVVETMIELFEGSDFLSKSQEFVDSELYDENEKDAFGHRVLKSGSELTKKTEEIITQFGLTMNEILEGEQFRKAVLWGVVANAAHSVGKLLKNSLDDAVSTAEKAIDTENVAGRIGKEAIDLIKDISTEAIDRYAEIWVSYFDDYFSKVDAGNADKKQIKDALFEEKYEEQFEGLNDVKIPFSSYSGRRAIEMLTNMVTKGAFGDIKNEESLSSGIAGRLFVGGFQLILQVFRAWIQTIVESAKLQKILTKAEQQQIKNSLNKVDELCKEFEKTISAYNGVSYDFGNLIAKTVDCIVEVVYWFNYLPEETRTAVMAVIETIDATTIFTTGTESILKDESLMETIQQIVFSGNSFNEQVEKIKKEYTSKEFEKEFDKDSHWEEMQKKIDGIKDTSRTVTSAIKIIVAVWDSLIESGGNLATSIDSVGANLTGAHSQSLSAERANQCYLLSNDLEETLRNWLRGGRVEAIIANGNLPAEWNNDNRLRYSMNSKDVLYKDKDGNYIATPNIEDIYTVCQYIILQMNYDAVGMGAYLTVLATRDNFHDTDFSRYFLGNNDETQTLYGFSYPYVLIEEDEAQKRYDQIVYYLNDMQYGNIEDYSFGGLFSVS